MSNGGTLASAVWTVTGAQQISVVSYYNISAVQVVNATGVMRFNFDGLETIIPSDALVITTALGEAVQLVGALATLGGRLVAAVGPITGTTVRSGSLIVQRASAPFRSGAEFPTPIVSTLI